MRENWREFINTCIESEHKKYSKTEEARHRKELDLHYYELLDTNLTRDQRVMVDEVMFARCVALERDGERLYEQGMRDAVWLLKKLGVFGVEV